MANRKGRHVSTETLDAKIERAQERVVSAKAAYDQAVEELKELMDKRNAIRKDDLYNRFVKSEWTYEQIVRILSSSPPKE